jgi:hypothetical protein
LNLINGQQKTFFETTTPRGDVTNASAGFYVMRLSQDKKIAYILADGPTILGSASCLYSYNLSTGTSKYLINVPGGQEALSPDDQKVASIQSNPKSSDTTTVLHVQNISTGNDVTTTLASGLVDPALVWSPNSDKLLYHTTASNDVVSIFNPETDTATQLQSTPNDTYHAFDYLFWVDENHITYALDTTTIPSTFSLGQTFEEDLTTQASAPLTPASSASYIFQVVSY